MSGGGDWSQVATCNNVLTQNAYGRTSSGQVLQATFDFLPGNTSNKLIIGLIPSGADVTYYQMHYCFYTGYDQLYLAGPDWGTSKPLPLSTPSCIKGRLTLDGTRGCLWEYNYLDGTGWHVGRDNRGLAGATNATSYKLAIMQYASGPVQFDNVKLAYVNPNRTSTVPCAAFTEDFSGSAINTSVWNVSNPAPGSVSGGWLQASGSGTWDRSMTTQNHFSIPTNKAMVEIEWIVDMEGRGLEYLGLGGSKWAGFMMMDNFAGGGSVGGIHLQTGYWNSYGFQCDVTDPYPIGSRFRLKMRLLDSGTISYYVDSGSGYHLYTPVQAIDGATGTISDLTTWTPSSSPTLYLAILPAVGTFLKIDRISVTTWDTAPAAFADDFSGSALDTSKWNDVTGQGVASVSGGYLTTHGTGTWANNLTTENKFLIPTDKAMVEIEWLVTMQGRGIEYLGLGGSKCAGFMMMDDFAGGGSVDGIHLQTYYWNSYGFQCDQTAPYPIGTDFRLKMRLLDNGTISYFVDSGSGYQLYSPVQAVYGAQGSTSDLTTWTPSSSPTLYLDILPAVGDLLKVNQVSVTTWDTVPTVFEEQFSGSTLDTSKWNDETGQGVYSIGGGYLTAHGSGTWDNYLTTENKFSIPTDKAMVEIEWVVQMADHNVEFVGLGGDRVLGFELFGSDAGAGSSNGIHLQQIGTWNSYGWQCDQTAPYPIGTDFRLKMRLLSNGTIAYFVDTGQGYWQYNPVLAIGSPSGNISDLTTWSPASQPNLFVEIAPAVGNLLKINRVTVTTSDILPTAPATTALTQDCYNNVADYTYMWWANGFRDASYVFNVQTSRWGLSFDYDAFALTRFGPISNPATEDTVLTQTNTTINNLPATSITATVEVNGVNYNSVGAGQGSSPVNGSCRTVESGKYFQRMDLDHISYGVGGLSSHLEVAAWPDRAAFILHVTPQSTITNGAVDFALTVPASYSNYSASAYGDGGALYNASGAGYVFLRTESSSTITFSGTQCKVRLPVANWTAGVEQIVGLIVYPVASGCSTVLGTAGLAETAPLQVSANQILPSPVTNLMDSPAYDRKRGYYSIHLRNDNSAQVNSRMDRVNVSITNPNNEPCLAHLRFDLESTQLYEIVGISGISALLCDQEGNPTGIPIQLSKDWHREPGVNLPFMGVWFHGMTMLTIPANTTLNLQYTSVNGNWGGVAPASHSQLSLIGYTSDYAGPNALWDEAAMGSWGESICFDPDVQGSAMIADVRPVMVWNMGASARDDNAKWSWTNNVGGGDFLTYFVNGVKQYNIRMRTQYRRQCPNQTEVTYAGTSQDGKINLKSTVNLIRSDDIVRIFFHLRYDVTQTVTWSRLAFFQLGADGYNQSQCSQMSRGNLTGVLDTWAPSWGTGYLYNQTGIACAGQMPWFSLHQNVTRDPYAYHGAWANRGLVIRSWNARLNGVNSPTPYASVYGSPSGGVSGAILELTPPPGVTQLQNGDYVDTVLEMIVMPQWGNTGPLGLDYYGPNANLIAALNASAGSYGGANTYGMINREAVGNNLSPTVSKGTLLNNYPVKIRVDGNNEAAFSVTGGVGYVPVMFTGVKYYRDYVLQCKVGGVWVNVDQSVYFKDFWQTDYNLQTGTWDVTYNVPLDGSTYSDFSTTREFRFFPQVKSFSSLWDEAR